MDWSKKTLSLGTAAALAAFLAPQGAFAQWDNGNADNDWDNPLNWGGTFPTGANATVDLAGADRAVISATPTNGPVIDIFVGSGAGLTGELDLTAGSASSGGGNWSFVGQNGGVGTFNVADTTGSGGITTNLATGSGTFTTNRLYVGGRDFGDAGTGTLNVNTQGSIDLLDTGGPTLSVGHNPGAVGTMNMDNGTVNAGYEAWWGADGEGTLNMSGGTINTGAWTVFGRGSGGVGTLNMTGGALNASTVDAASFVVFGSFGGSVGVGNVSGGTIDASAGAGVYLGEGGTGTLNLSDTATVTGGALRIGLNDGGVGTLAVTGSSVSVSVTDVSLGLDSTLVDTTALGTLSFVADAGGVSTILASGDVNLGSDGDTLLVDLTGYTGAHVDMQLIDGATSSGAFTGLAQGTLAATDGNANPYYIDYTVAGDVWLTTTPIPEPASVALLGLGSLCLVRRRK